MFHDDCFPLRLALSGTGGWALDKSGPELFVTTLASVHGIRSAIDSKRGPGGPVACVSLVCADASARKRIPAQARSERISSANTRK